MMTKVLRCKSIMVELGFGGLVFGLLYLLGIISI
jgi:hypothetical protein